ncbi:Nucleoporin NUP192 [Colletotrichum orbiculare MAFF 240422]|uniref:Nucleoporin NUP192 n=1 Tax=Colletotrichum orbiculare (strain 104-T / ATCC 96160 / CBS 514.97 / LARS 414 / MAFF 240422) TaxID=1213857 RepID=N4USC1_COLOR|nr:Nucleoporin NUP192 [Colletotrichum orbiculare MAFF 240422]
MAETTTLDALQAFHRDLAAVRDGRPDGADSLENPIIQSIFERELERVWQRPPRDDKSRNQVKSGKIVVDDEEYSVNENFQQIVFNLADETEINEIEAARYVLESEEDPAATGRPLLECALIRVHQQRKYVLDCVRLMLEIDGLDEDDIDPEILNAIQMYLSAAVFQNLPGETASSQKRLLPKCMKAMQDVRSWIQKIADKMTAAAVLINGRGGQIPEEMETIEFSRVSLYQQHELLAIVLCRTIEKRDAEVGDFKSLLQNLKGADKYDVLLAHYFPALGAYITLYGSTEGASNLTLARELHPLITDESPWRLIYLQAAVKAWWLSEYSGWYLDDSLLGGLEGVDLDQEDRQRSKQFLEALKDGAFDFILSIAADVKTPEWVDPSRITMRNWLQRKAPPLATESIHFSDHFQQCLMAQLEVFVDAFISNLPDVLRKLRVEEDEQRQLSQSHEQDLDLERFLVIIAYAYEGRPDAAMNFWSDPDSNLAGFMHWASRRASTPLVSSFCEMLQAISCNDECATAAHEFLLDEGHHASGKMRRSQSLTWHQIFRELVFFSNKIRERLNAPQASSVYRPGRPSSDQAEAEPESTMMLQSYLRLITKLASESETARQFLLQDPSFNLVEMLFQLASTYVPPDLRAGTFMALRALISRKNHDEANIMWQCLEAWMNGAYIVTPAQHRSPQSSPVVTMDSVSDDICHGFDEPHAFIQLLIALVTPPDDSSSLNDGLPFPENLGSANRMPGIEVYVDTVLGTVFANRANEVNDINQLRMLRLSCLEFATTCLSTFNENLIVIANETNIPIDSAMSATDLATYVKLHPFARVMEWMFNDKVINALYQTIHQSAVDVGNATPDSPVILGILRAVDVISKVLDLQATFLDLVRPIIKMQSNHRRPPVANAAYASFEDGLVGHLGLVVDLGSYCGLGHPDLTLACLKLLEKMTASFKMRSAWSSSPGRKNHRNKAIVAMESNGEHEAISRSLATELTTPLDLGREAESPNYLTKCYILDFLISCLLASPDKPTIAHLLLGFQCGVDTLAVEADGSFAARNSLFHSMLRLLLETPFGDVQGMRQWLVSLKSKCMRILRVLWTSPLSGPLVIDELRENDVLFHFLLREVVIQPALPWEGQEIGMPQFPLTDGAPTLIDFLALRSMSLEYIAMELCSVSQSRKPSLKRRIFDALNGQIVGDNNEPMTIPTVFDLYDFLLPSGIWDMTLPTLQFYKNLDLGICLEEDDHANAIYNIDRAREILLLKRSESRDDGVVLSAQDFAALEREEAVIIDYLIFTNRQKRIASQSLGVLKTWTRLLLVMVESNEFKGTTEASFYLQALQAILPGLEASASERPEEAVELAKLARVLLFKLDLTSRPSLDRESQAIGSLVSDKLYQLFQLCLQAIGKWAGSSDLRAVYYSICYRYLTGMFDQGLLVSGRQKTIKTIQIYGERLINVICDDAYGSDAACQTAAFILLNALVNLGRQEDDSHIVETLNRLNFIGILVDSLRTILQDWTDVVRSGNSGQETYVSAKFALLLQLAQTKAGAKYILHANLLRSIEASGLFAADPELQSDAANPKALEKHYELLAKVTRLVSAAIVSRGDSNILQGRKFLTEHRMLVTHTLKRNAGIGAVEGEDVLEERIEELAEAFMVLIAATGFLEFENEVMPEPKKNGPVLFT